jgi:hypothetical protein
MEEIFGLWRWCTAGVEAAVDVIDAVEVTSLLDAVGARRSMVFCLLNDVRRFLWSEQEEEHRLECERRKSVGEGMKGTDVVLATLDLC